MRMRASFAMLVLLMGLAWGVCVAQQVVDRIVARIEDDIITLSEVRELGRFQVLLEGHNASDEKLLRQLIEQWILSTEAATARFPRPTDAEVDREAARLEKEFPSVEAYRARLRELGLSAEGVRRLLERRLWLARYLDYKFRPVVRVEEAEIERNYREELVPQLTAGGQALPPLEAVREQIRELLIQQGISERVGRWLEESQSRLRIEIQPGEKVP